MNDPNAKPVLTDENITFPAFADAGTSGSIDLGHINTNQGVIYQMTTETQTKPLNQTYYEEVEALKATGMSTPTPSVRSPRSTARKRTPSEAASISTRRITSTVELRRLHQDAVRVLLSALTTTLLMLARHWSPPYH
jgi:hypothetical protein